MVEPPESGALSVATPIDFVYQEMFEDPVMTEEELAEMVDPEELVELRNRIVAAVQSGTA
jgi:hypothetical protein